MTHYKNTLLPLSKGKLRSFKSITGLISALLILASPTSYGLPSDAGMDIIVYADKFELNNKEDTITYIGSVVMEQGSMKINADKLVLHGKLNRASRVLALGKPARFTQVPSVGEAPVNAAANTLEYQIDEKTLVLIDNAALDQDGASLTGARIEYDVKKALVKAGGADSETSETGRVRVVIPPKTLQSKDEQERQPEAAEPDTLPLGNPVLDNNDESPVADPKASAESVILSASESSQGTALNAGANTTKTNTTTKLAPQTDSESIHSQQHTKIEE